MTESVAKAVVVVETAIAFVLLSICYDSVIVGAAVALTALAACYLVVFQFLPRIR